MFFGEQTRNASVSTLHKGEQGNEQEISPVVNLHSNLRKEESSLIYITSYIGSKSSAATSTPEWLFMPPKEICSLVNDFAITEP